MWATALGIAGALTLTFMAGIVADRDPDTSPWPRRRGLVTLSEAEDPAPSQPAGARADRPVLAEVPAPNRAVRPRYVPQQLLIRFAPGLSPKARAAARADIGVSRLQRLPLPGLELVAVVDERDVASVRARAQAHPGVVYSEPNFVYRASATPNDEFFGSLWGLNNVGQTVAGRRGSNDADIDAVEAWDVTSEGNGIEIAVADSGIAYDHPDLAGNIWTNTDERIDGTDNDGNGLVDDAHGWDWVSADADPRDQNGHGTHVAGTIGAVANNDRGVAGIDWSAEMIPLRVLDAHGEGNSADIASALSYAVEKDVEVVNISFGGPDSSRAILDVIRSAPDTLFIAAAGNEAADNDSIPTYPCNYDVSNVVCVAASGMTDAISSFSNRGEASVDLAAPGSTILSTIPQFEMVFSDGFDDEIGETWVTGGTSPWERTSSGYISDSPTGSYANAADSFLRLVRSLDLSGLSGCRVGYALRLETGSNDGLLVEAATPGSSWRRLSGWSGSTDDQWIEVSDDLNDFDGESGVAIRFRFVSDSSGVADGVDIDDVEVECSSSDYSGDEYAFKSGTSMAAPHVSGAAAVLWTAAPRSSTGDISAALLDGADRLAALDGLIVGGRRLNLAGALGRLGVGSAGEGSPHPTAAEEQQEGDVAEREDGGGGGGGGGGSSPEEEDEPSAEPSEASSPSPSDPPAAGQAAARSVTLGLTKHLIARGRVSGGCASGAVVKLKRNGSTIRRVETAADGTYKVRLPDRAGRYVAKVAALNDCETARSAPARHGHN